MAISDVKRIRTEKGPGGTESTVICSIFGLFEGRRCVFGGPRISGYLGT